MEFALGVGYIVIGIVSLAILILVIYLACKLVKKVLRFDISEKATHIIGDIAAILTIISYLVMALIATASLAYQVGRFIMGLL